MVKLKSKPATKVVEEIEALKENTGLDYIDTIIEYCQRNDLEIESIVSVVKNSTILPKLEIDAKAKNFISKGKIS